MHNLPLVSIVIPCYNHEAYILDSIQSVIDQSYDNIELIIIDDGSKDQSVEKIQSMIEHCKKRFNRFEFRSRPNKGLSATLNEAIEWCQGEYYSALASDDKMMPLKTEKQVEILNDRQDIVAVFGAVELISYDNSSLGYIRQNNKIYGFNDLFYTDSFLPAPTQMIRLKSLVEAGGYVDGMIVEDWYSYLKLLEKGGKIMYTDELFAFYRSHGENTFSNPYKMALGRLQVINCFSQHDLFKRVFIKTCWENIFELIRNDFKLSVTILFGRIIFRLKMIIKKIKRS